MVKLGHEIPEDELARLYGAPRDRFTAERNDLAKRLRTEGEGSLADEVQRLKKPSVSAWAVNQAVRANPAEAKRLLEAGERLREGQDSALRGKGDEELRTAIAEEHEAVERMIDAVREATGGPRGISPTMVERATETLRAVAGDEELRQEFAAGRVARDRKPGWFGGELPAGSPPRSQKRAGPTVAQRRRGKERARTAKRNLDSAVKRVAEARRNLERAERGVESARAKLEKAEAQRRESESKLEDARAALAGHES